VLARRVTPRIASRAASRLLGVRPAAGVVALATNENGIYLPASIEESTAIGGTLNTIWPFQGASSPLADIPDAALDMTANGTLGYQQAIEGWDRVFVNMPEVANNRLTFGTAVFPATESFVLLLLARINAAGASARRIANLGTSGVLNISANSNGTLNLNVATVQASGAVDYVTDASARLFSIEWDIRDAGAVRVRTALETIAGTYGAVGDHPSCHLGGSGGLSPPDIDLGWAGLARGANAEALIDANPITVYTVPA